MIVNSGLTVEREAFGAEPVDLDAIKRHLAIDFDEHNDLLEELLVAAREDVENYTGLSLVDSTITASWKTLCSSELPYGPVKNIISVSDGIDEIEVLSYGGAFKSVTAERIYPTTITYETGFEKPIPQGLKLAILKLASDNFEQRTGISIGGNQTIQTFGNDWKNTCKRYSRKNAFQ